MPRQVSGNPKAAMKMFLEGYNCAQAVLVCCGERYGLPRETAIRVGQAFGGGMGKTGNVCGAVTGALMVVGLQCAVTDGSDSAAKQEAHRLAQEFMARFKALHGSLLCRELLDCDLSTKEGSAKAHETGVTKAVCPGLVRDAAKIIEEVLFLKEQCHETK